MNFNASGFKNYATAVQYMEKLRSYGIACGETAGGVWVAADDVEDEVKLGIACDAAAELGAFFHPGDTPLMKHLTERLAVRKDMQNARFFIYRDGLVDRPEREYLTLDETMDFIGTISVAKEEEKLKSIRPETFDLNGVRERLEHLKQGWSSGIWNGYEVQRHQETYLPERIVEVGGIQIAAFPMDRDSGKRVEELAREHGVVTSYVRQAGEPTMLNLIKFTELEGHAFNNIGLSEVDRYGTVINLYDYEAQLMPHNWKSKFELIRPLGEMKNRDDFWRLVATAPQITPDIMEDTQNHETP
jgi:hypothetical protein